jgi:two-component system LytT family response regulator
MIKVAIIDDDPDMTNTNSSLLKKYFPEIEIVGLADSVSTGISLIKDRSPQLVLLDIELKDGTGFDILQQIKNCSFQVIFITAFNQFGIKAIKFSAIDYILKPVNEYEFKKSIENALSTIESSEIEKQIETFFSHYEKKAQIKKIVLKTLDFLHIIDISDIIYCKSDNSYTTFFLNSGEEILVSKSIKEYNEILSDYHFFKPHQSFLVNLNYVKRIDKSTGGFLILKSGSEIAISSRRKPSLIKMLENL